MSALGVVKHLGWVERGWFRDVFAGEDVEAIDEDGDNSPEFAIGGDETVESVLTFYRAEVEHSRRVAHRTLSLDALSAGKRGSATVSASGGSWSTCWRKPLAMPATSISCGKRSTARSAIEAPWVSPVTRLVLAAPRSRRAPRVQPAPSTSTRPVVGPVATESLG